MGGKKPKRERLAEAAEAAEAAGGAAAGAAEAAEPAKKKRHEEPSTSGRGRGSGRGGGLGRGGRGGDQGRGGGRGGKPFEDTSRPSAMHMLRARKGRPHTLSIALPASILDNAQSWEMRAVLVGQIARACAIFSVDEVVLFEDRSDAEPSADGDGLSRAMAFFARNLQYLETPQYLRRQLLPMHRDLRHVGLLAPLDAPHHVRRNERVQYREGAVVPKDKCPTRPTWAGSEPGCWVNVGLNEPVWVPGREIPGDVRVTVRMDAGRSAPGEDEEDAAGEDGEVGATPSSASRASRPRPAAVPPREPTTRLGLYWGYQVRIAKSFKEVFDACPYEGGYDLTFGTSERGEALGVSRVPRYSHLLLVFGGVAGLEEVVADENSGYKAGTNPAKLFTRYVNVCPTQTSRTIRTEEALLITLAALKPYLPA